MNSRIEMKNFSENLWLGWLLCLVLSVWAAEGKLGTLG